MDGKLHGIGSGGNSHGRGNRDQVGPVDLDGELQSFRRRRSAYADQGAGCALARSHLREQPENDFGAGRLRRANAAGIWPIERVADVDDLPFEQASGAQQSVTYVRTLEEI